MIKLIFAFLLLSLELLFSHETDKKFITISPEPEDYAWWLRAEYNPFSVSVRGIPVQTLSKDWCYANEFTPELFTEEYMKDISPELVFSLQSKLKQSKMQTALVGAYETCDKKKGLFVLILDSDTNAVNLLSETPSQNSLIALRLTEKETLQIWWCSSCSDYSEIGWNEREKKYISIPSVFDEQ